VKGEEFLFIGGIFIGAIVSFLITLVIINEIWQENTVKHGCAEYNQKTGHFEWKGKNE
jgi:hypothetical protein